MELTLLMVFILWMIAILIVGLYAAKLTTSTSGFFLGDRKMGSWVTGVSAAASSESGWVVLGAVGEAYMWGASAVWIAVGCVLGYILN